MGPSSTLEPVRRRAHRVPRRLGHPQEVFPALCSFRPLTCQRAGPSLGPRRCLPTLHSLFLALSPGGGVVGLWAVTFSTRPRTAILSFPKTAFNVHLVALQPFLQHTWAISQGKTICSDLNTRQCPFVHAFTFVRFLDQYYRAPTMCQGLC